MKIKKRDQENQKRDQENYQDILLFCESPKNILEIMNELGYKNRTKFKAKYLTPLIKAGQLQMTEPDNPTNRNQKYETKK